MKIEIENFTIEDDLYGFILWEKKVSKKTGKTYIEYLYPKNLEASFKLIRKKINKNDTTNFKEMEKYIERIKKLDAKFIKDVEELQKIYKI